MTDTPIKNNFPPVVAAVGGIDPSAGAGLFIDQMAIQSTGCHFAGICATLTIQDGRGFIKSTPQPPVDIEKTLELLHRNTPFSAIKTGALGDIGIIDVLCQFKARHPAVTLVVDPVLRSTTGGDLLAENSESVFRTKLFPVADLITPNIPEAAAIAGMRIASVPDMETAAQTLIEMGAGSVLLKGGHLLVGSHAVDILARKDLPVVHLQSPRLNVGEVRGTGCALASLIASQIALGESIENGVEKARRTLVAAMRNARFPNTGPGILRFVY